MELVRWLIRFQYKAYQSKRRILITFAPHPIVLQVLVRLPAAFFHND